jgi:hypothetical protein
MVVVGIILVVRVHVAIVEIRVVSNRSRAATFTSFDITYFPIELLFIQKNQAGKHFQ